MIKLISNTSDQLKGFVGVARWLQPKSNRPTLVGSGFVIQGVMLFTVDVVHCNGQLKLDTFLGSLSIKYMLKFQRRLVA